MSRLVAKLLPILALALIAGCGGHAAPTQPAPDPLAGMPAPNSPAAVIRALEWAINHRSTAAYKLLFTSDFVFRFAGGDSAGNDWGSDHPWSRVEEEGSFATFVQGGGPDQPAATECQLRLDKNLLMLNDPRPGKYDPVRRRSIPANVNVTVTTSDGAATNVFGSWTFYVVRGDIAKIPPDLGLAPDSTRWWIERWDDNTNGAADVQARTDAPLPTRMKTWGDLKLLYLPASLRP